MSNEVAIQLKISDRVAEYEKKKDNINQQAKLFTLAGVALQTACTVRGTYGQVQLDIGRACERAMYENLLKSAWLNIHETLNLKVLMTAKDKKLFDQAMADPPEFTKDNIRATFGNYIIDPWGNILRGLAEVFCDLDQSYKSHEKVKIGVSGLPKRIIMSGFGEYNYWGWEKLASVVNALAKYQNKSLVSHYDLKNHLPDKNNWYTADHYNSEGLQVSEKRGFVLKLFKNGNAHMIFEPDALKDINLALAEYYGDVLADCHEARPDKHQESTDVSKDLQYYPTPEAVAKKIIEDLYIQDGEAIMEPSCGCGRFMDEIYSRVMKEGISSVRMMGIEVDPARAEEAKAKGHAVLIANFLETEPEPKFDRVVMNPPFYGKHYAKHIEHALKFLKDGGTLTAILPITARYDHGLVDGHWDDLPVGSFSNSGTNINTTVLTIHK